jgi:poly(3-hydroxybutyrate) depolymerase
MNRRLLPPLLTLLCLTLSTPAQEPHRTGSFTATFTDRSPLSAIPDVGKRMGWTTDMMKRSKSGDNPLELEYDLSNESFEILVPTTYAQSDPWGLFVFINPGPTGRPHRQDWLPILEKHKLILIAPNKAGNHRAVWIRMALALDAAHNMKQRYTLDDRRTYVAGVSGGGRTASFLGVCFPDVFTGGFYMIGCNMYKQLPSTEQPGKYFAKAFSAPPAQLFTLAKKRSRHVLLTGDTDANREQTKVNHDAMVKDGFAHATYFQVPGMGHEAPSAEWFEKAILELDKFPPVAAPPATRPATPRTRTAAATSKPPADPAASLLSVARTYIANKRYPQARDRLNRILRDHPTTPAAAEAKKLLEEIDGK